ncbi:MAG: mandelate racemase/muconate lactonizing enzyme family protein [Dehalococcoidia bacterium]|jgi:D-arabinonate dehydratase/D-galactarolactone cycloisomerase|nr:mandelate racemase/muconate lactonizing enzyme family protein [SAR202 cluster bacterium]MDP7212897.1 mandelate racemase/muconate lactonizing enzyme family protein [Dehalococcoidia bacterium]HJN53380.1 mandelate racemase/muconate lactonizing enzyme family protein [Pseudomonadales bacterium]|tara:strand:+ start:2040 stop:3164 length:1125 start_codon:yes stop_codon:yes gene_type:complete
MKITDITLTFLKIGKGLLRVQTDAGVEGWAEAPGRNPDAQGGEYGYYSGRVFEAYLESIIKPVLIGEDPLQIERHWETLALGKDEKLFKLPSDVVGVIDVALWDLMGKETGLPVYALMGGAARRDIELYWSTGSGWMLQPEEMLNLVEKGWDMNFRSFKIRMDWKGWRQDADPEKDYQMFKLVREFLAEGNYLGFDANNGYSVSTAIWQGRRFEELGIDHFEEPIPNWNLPGLKQVSDALDVAVAAGEQDAFRWWFQSLVLLGDPDILQPDILSAGGPSEVKRIFDMATTLGKPVMPHSPQAGINSMASLHVFSTIQNGTRPHEFSTEFSGPLDDVANLFGDGVIPKDGHMILSDKPGLGIELNEKAVADLTLA